MPLFYFTKNKIPSNKKNIQKLLKNISKKLDTNINICYNTIYQNKEKEKEMYNENKNEKCYTFEETTSITVLGAAEVSKILGRFNINEEAVKSNLLIEVFSNDTDDKLDYDITLEILKDNFNSKSYCLKTSSNLESIKQEYNNYITYARQ